ncbi:MAG TPA: DUF883 family protein [Burkholderiales bacterium]|jgi:ElaB/YqjD/DUF883 family membrane-anchored ribosome-binding protein|nr:DUF883 family protein [Burkholderiales bacterium]
MQSTNDIANDKLATDLRRIIVDAEELLRATANQAGEKVAAARARVQDSLDSAKLKLELLGEEAADQARAAVRATDDYVHDHPWQSVGIAAMVGLVLGMMISRK